MASRILLYATTNWPSAARYAGGFAAAGCEAHVACPTNALVRKSRYAARLYDYRPLAPISSLGRAITSAAPDLIIPCDDRAVLHILRLYELHKRDAESPIAALIARSLGSPENYARVLSRYGSLAELKQRGVRIPDTVPIASETDLDSSLATMGLPAVLKADGSWGGEGVVIARTRQEALAAYRKLSRAPSRLRSLFRALRRHDAHFLVAALAPKTAPVCVQRFIPGRPAASAFAAQDGKVLAGFHYDVLVADRVIGPPNVIRHVEDCEMDEAVRAVAACFGLSGLHGLDFIRDDTGKVHLIEINPRATQGGALPFGNGRDLPAALAQTLSNEPVGRRTAVPSDLVVFYPREIRRDPTSPYLAEGYHDVPRDDPEVLRALGQDMPRPGLAKSSQVVRALRSPFEMLLR